MIAKNSRYAKTGRTEVVTATGEKVEILELRETPRAEGVFRHTPIDGERLDHLAHRYLRDPRKFWVICDVCDELDPFDVVVPGRPVVIPPDK